jgi:hypothetical protein
MSISNNLLKVLTFLRPHGLYNCCSDYEICEGAGVSPTEFSEVRSLYIKNPKFLEGGNDCTTITALGISYLESLPKIEEMENLEMQKLRGEIDIIASTLSDYPKVKNRLSRNELVAWLAVILTLIDIIAQLKGCKSG